jgi:predicted P-loop ATPase
VADLIKFPEQPDAEAYAHAETERKCRLFAWADALLQQLGLTAKVAQAQSADELRRIVLDIDDVEIELAIRDALHPAAGKRADHFAGMKAGALKRLLKMRFGELRRDREAELLHGRAGAAGGKRSSPHWTNDLKVDATGGIRPILANLILFLREHPTWKGVLAFDEFGARAVIRKRPYWGNELPDAPWTDHHESLTRVWFQREDIAVNQGDVGRAVQAAARSNCFHPARDFFDALVWDGKARIDDWLHVYLHADDTSYARAISPRFLISGVARIYQPGCKVDHMLVLESQQQGKQKSEALRTLAVRDDWFTDRLSHVTSKDAAQEMAGVLLVEISEMEALLRATSSASKAFITRRFDRYRPPYGRYTINKPRQCVFAGSINPPVGGYLKDPTGARRIWPVFCPDVIDLEALARDRDQLWAEAVVRFKAGAKWWLETPDLEALAIDEQNARYKSDPWQELIEKWLGKHEDTSVAEVLEHALDFAPREQNRSAEMRVAAILTRLGFSKHRPRSKGGARTKDARKNRYWR